jgi:hypothetical protein
MKRATVCLAEAKAWRIVPRRLIRAEFTDIFNRSGLDVPSDTNAFAPDPIAAGVTTRRFGWISTAAPAARGGGFHNGRFSEAE